MRHDRIYIECQGVKHRWHDNPLYIFDDTLMHRSVNELDARRYCVLIDIMRPKPVPDVFSGLISLVLLEVEQFKSVFYKNWKMLRPTGGKA